MYHKFQNTKNVSSFNYDMSTGKLIVRFKSGRDYKYTGLTVADVLDFIKEEDNYTSKLKKFKYTELK